MLGVLTAVKKIGSDNMRPVKEAYCRLYGYELIYSDFDYFSGRSFEWRKIGMLLEHLQKFDWVVYVAPNVGFANFTVPLERIVNEQSKGRGIIAARDSSCSASTDVLFFRNDMASVEFLKSWGDEKTYARWGGGVRHDAHSFYKLATETYSGKVSLVVPCRVFNSFKIIRGGNSRKTYHVGDFVENCSMIGIGDVAKEASRILKSNNEYIKGIKRIAKLEIDEEICGEKNMITRAEKVCGPPKIFDSLPGSVEKSVQSSSTCNEVNLVDYLSEKSSDAKAVTQRKIVLETPNEKITIFKNSVDKGEASVDAERATRNGKWGFSYPSI